MRLIHEAHDLEGEKDKHNERIKEINKRLEVLAIEAAKEFSLDDDPELILPGIGRCFVTTEPHFNILAGNKQEFIERLKNDPNTAGLVREDVPPASLKAYFREAIRETGALPHADLVNQYDQPVIKFRKERK